MSATSLSLILLGVLCIIFGFVIIKMQLVNAAARSANVKPENVKAFTKLVGLATVGFGLALLCHGIFSSFNLNSLGIIIFIIIFIISLVIYLIAQSKYN